jgi:hypothetical protein
VFVLPGEEGTVIGRVTVTPGAPWGAGTTFTFDDVALQTSLLAPAQPGPTLTLPAP